mmetsp:Transcript_48459/g.156002  ORF Transcript_48459/g.156002 Transcript_48459/m.156002 type:complete len:280 (+) Transcript_48459:206-1045(+)
MAGGPARAASASTVIRREVCSSTPAASLASPSSTSCWPRLATCSSSHRVLKTSASVSKQSSRKEPPGGKQGSGRAPMRQVRQQVYVRRGGADETLGHMARTAAKTAAREARAPDEAARAARNRSVDDADVPRVVFVVKAGRSLVVLVLVVGAGAAAAAAAAAVVIIIVPTATLEVHPLHKFRLHRCHDSGKFSRFKKVGRALLVGEAVEPAHFVEPSLRCSWEAADVVREVAPEVARRDHTVQSEVAVLVNCFRVQAVVVGVLVLAERFHHTFVSAVVQ